VNGLKEVTLMDFHKETKRKAEEREEKEEEINKQIMKNEETRLTGNECMYVFCSIITRICCFGKTKNCGGGGAKFIKQWEAIPLMEKGIPDPDGLCCNYRTDCNRLTRI
jgi:hypothetical protein